MKQITYVNDTLTNRNIITVNTSFIIRKIKRQILYYLLCNLR